MLTIFRVPPNVHFEVDDVEQEWTYSRKFDFIHCRTMGNAIKDWPALVKRSFEYVVVPPPSYTPCKSKP